MRPVKRQRLHLYLSVFIFLCSLIFCLSPACAKERETPIICEGDKVEFLEKGQTVSAIDNVVIIYEDLRITCDKAIVSLNTKQARAEGNVVLYQKDSVLTGDKVEYSFATQSGKVYKAGFISQLIYGRGPLAIKEGPNEINMDKSYMTTCDLDEPHYRIEARRVKVFLGDRVEMRHVIFYAFDLPLFYLPFYSYSLKEEERPKVTFIPGKTEDWGYYLLSAWRYEFNQYMKGLVHLDYRERKDFASGFENYYQINGFGEGLTKAYYMNERTLEQDHFYKQPRISHERERYMIHHRHDWNIDADTDLLLQYWNLSDADFLEDYFYEDEYLRNASPESYLSIIRTKSDYSLSLLARKRFNKIFERVEYQPELKLDIPGLRIGGSNSTLYWNSESSFANISRKYAYPSDVDEDTVRFDSYNRLSYGLKMGFLNLTPYGAVRETYYTKDIDGEGDWWRTAYYGGMGIETKFYRIFGLTSDLWGMDINKLRHVITPRISYDYISDPTVGSDRLVQFDGVDSLSGANSIGFSLENKLQTKREVSGGKERHFEAVDLARLSVGSSYNYQLPSGSRFADITFDFEFSPFNWMSLEFDTAYDHLEDRFKTFNLDLYTDYSDKLKCGLGYRYAHESHSEAAVELSLKPTPLWKLGVYQRFMFKGYPHSKKKINSLQVQEYRLVRDLHCWTSEIIYNVTRDKGESLYFVFRLKAFPEMPVEFGTSYHRPKEGSFNAVR